jgi:lysophospholipase L1-like esterase
MLKTLATLLALLTAFPAPAAGPHWVAAWGAPPDQAGTALGAQTIRQVIRPTLAGSAIRLRLSNLYGEGPLTLGPVRVARSAGGPAIRLDTDAAVTFAGRATVTLPKGGEALSDPVALPVAAFEDLAVSLYLPDGAAAPTLHGVAMATAYLAPGDHTRDARLPARPNDSSRYLLTGVEVAAAPGARALVILGDSITDGVGSTDDANRRWPDLLAQRLHADPALANIAVVNAGIAGNRILNDAAKPFIGPSSLHRFERDVLGQPGVRWVLILQGSNDISAADRLTTPKDQVSAEQVIAGLQALIDRAHARGLKVYGGTLLPYEAGKGPFPGTPAGHEKRRVVRAWIRNSGAFDAVVDFHAAVVDPDHPGELRPAFDSGDHLHPNDAGHAALAAAVDLGLFR